MKKYSKKQLAKGYLALAAHAPRRALSALAASLIEQRATREVEIAVREIDRLLLAQGIARVHIATARPVSEKQRHTLESLIRHRTGAEHVQAEYTVDPTLHGGFTVTAPTFEINGSVAGTLHRLAHSSSHPHV